MRIEDFIKENREKFNTEEPLKGHFERFEQRLKKSKEEGKKENTHYRSPSNLKLLISIAAVMVGLVFGFTFFMNGEQKSQSICIVSGEMHETQNYYMSRLNAEAVHVEQLLNNVEPETRSEIMGDIKKIIDESENFASTFCNSSDNGIAIMMGYYQIKIETLQNISSIFENAYFD